MLEAGFLTAVGVIWILSRLNLKRVVGYALFWDVFITAGLTWLFIGTYAGMVTGMLAGLLVSIFLTCTKKTIGSERIVLIRKKEQVLPRFRWKEM